ncbi:MAG: hypothetical protein K6E56_00420 [Lachnospiraceae bacterium]|nr:hypothetical protein [Lachnospiraceae bacterium]
MKKIICIFVLALAFAAGMQTVASADVTGTAESISEAKAIFKKCLTSGDYVAEVQWTGTMAVDVDGFNEEVRTLMDDLAEAYKKTANSNGYILGAIGIESKSSISGLRPVVSVKLTPRSVEKGTIVKSEKDAYKKALKALKKQDYETKFVSKDDTDYTYVFKLVMEQHPEFTYGVGLSYYTSKSTVWFSLNSGYDKATVKKLANKANKKAAAIVKAVVKPGMTETEKANAIHNHIINNCEYDLDTYYSKDQYSNSYTAYGALCEGKAVCQGYAAAFNLCAQKAGLNSIAVFGTAGGGDHAWNYVYLDGKYSYIDTTWDDPVGYNGSSVLQTYFCISKEKLLKDHKFTAADFTSRYIKYSKFLIA